MAQEIERKFLVKGDFKSQSTKNVRIVQGYLSLDPERTVRVRIKDSKGFLTIKGSANKSGTTRFEWEKEIPHREARALLGLCGKEVICKTRYHIRSGKHVIEVDEFHDENEGLIVAEVELDREDEKIEKPPWMGVEVTGDKRYYNSMLVKQPFTTWR